MPTLLIPSTNKINYAAQELKLAKFKGAYYTPTALEMVAGLVMNDLCVRPERSKAGDCYSRYGWCSDELKSGDRAGWRVNVGCLNSAGLYFERNAVDSEGVYLGRAALRTIE